MSDARLKPFTEQIEHEDLLLFINSCFAGSSQSEFYSDRQAQLEALDFLHAYICVNYRPLYAATLALGVNHHNQQRIVGQLLARTPDLAERQDAIPEVELMRHCLRRLPPQRVFKLFAALAQARINHRRFKATQRDYLAWRRNLSFDAIKYRRLLRIFLRHSHLPLPPEVKNFLFGKGWKEKVYQDPLLETYRQAHFSAQALTKLPFSIAEGLAARHRLSREQLLLRMQGQLTDQERLRLQQSAARAGLQLDLDPRRVGLTQLLVWILSLPLAQRRERLSEFEAMISSCRERFAPAWLGFDRLAIVLDNSYSSSGSAQKRNRPLAIALGAHYLLGPLAKTYKPVWLHRPEHPLLAEARGQSSLAAGLLEALEWGATEIVIVSDGAENDPAGGVHWLLESLTRARRPDAAWPPPMPRMVHVNPVLRPEDFGPGSLSPHLATTGIREAENLPGLWILALFARKTLSRRELETYLRSAADAFLHAD